MRIDSDVMKFKDSNAASTTHGANAVTIWDGALANSTLMIFFTVILNDLKDRAAVSELLLTKLACAKAKPINRMSV